jgi:hypothetical protein
MPLFFYQNSLNSPLNHIYFLKAKTITPKSISNQMRFASSLSVKFSATFCYSIPLNVYCSNNFEQLPLYQWDEQACFVTNLYPFSKKSSPSIITFSTS